MVPTGGLRVGAGEVDITPPLDEKVFLAGSLDPRQRPAAGVHDPLFVRSLAIESGGEVLVVTSFDLIALERGIMGPATERAAREARLPADHLVWACSHTHSGPVTVEHLVPGRGRLVNGRALDRILDGYAESVRRALATRREARWSRLRGFERRIVHNRRLEFKGQEHINTWLLPEDDGAQCLGSAAGVDPEVGVLAFDDASGRLLGVIYQYALHACIRWGTAYSADYPGVVAAEIKKEFGDQAVPVFLPGACGDINPIVDCDTTGGFLAKVVCAALRRRAPRPDTPRVGARRRTVTVPMRDFTADQEGRIRQSRWPADCAAFFRASAEGIREAGRTEVQTVVQSWHIGDVGFACLPGELFMEWGRRIKARSPFPWTYPVELSGDWQGYLITREAWEGGGYEGLNASTGRLTPQAVEQMVIHGVEMLGELAKAEALRQALPVSVALANGARATVRALRPDDGERLARFYAAVPAEDYRFYCPHPLDREHALAKAAEAEQARFVCLALEDAKGEIAGYAWYRWEDGAAQSSFGICIRRDHQGVGAGQALMRPLLDIASRYGPSAMTLTVQKANPAALKLYRKMGFDVVREQRRASDQEPEYVMCRRCDA